MVKSGIIFGGVAFILILGSSLISPLCAPCVGLFMGLAAGYVAGVFDKPRYSRDSLKSGGIAGLIAGIIGLIGGLIGGAINGTSVNASMIEQFYRALGITNISISQSQLLTYQLLGAACIGIFNLVWMALLGLAGGAIWYQIKGKSQPGAIIPPQEPIPPAF